MLNFKISIKEPSVGITYKITDQHSTYNCEHYINILYRSVSDSMTVTLIQGRTLREPCALNLLKSMCASIWFVWKNIDFQVAQEQKMGAHPWYSQKA